MAFTAIQDESLNQSIAEAIIDNYVDFGENWSIEVNPQTSRITLIQNDRSRTFSSYADVLNALEDTILHDLGNFPLQNFDGEYIFYLQPDELNYLGLGQEFKEQLKHPVQLMNPEPFKTEDQEIISSPVSVSQPQKKETVKPKKKTASKTKRKNYTQLAKEIDQKYSILDVVKEAGLTLEKNSSKTMTTKEHDSLILNPEKNRFYWNSRGEANGSVRLYQLLMNKSFADTIKELSPRIGECLPLEKTVQEEEKQPSIREKEGAVLAHKRMWQLMQEKGCQNTNLKETFAYLTKTREIDPEIVQEFIDRGLLYQSKDENGRASAVFVGRNEFGLISSVCFRSTYSNSKFRGDYPGCDYERGWFYEPKEVGMNFDLEKVKTYYNTNKPLLVFESSIEMMSYISILKECQVDWRKFAYLSCGSIAKNICVDQTCELYGYKNVILMFNNDFDKERNWGKEAAENVQNRLQQKGIKANLHLPIDVKDYNDSLRMRHHKNEIQKKPVKVVKKTEHER